MELWTIGHSNHSGERFIELLKSFRIDVLADVRSQPYARYASHFSQAPLRQLLTDAGLQWKDGSWIRPVSDTEDGSLTASNCILDVGRQVRPLDVVRLTALREEQRVQFDQISTGLRS